MKELSKEQKDIIEAIKDSSVVINAVAGSGKTTTILEMCKDYPEKEFLVLTYNKSLADEANDKILEQKIKNCKLGTIHSIGGHFFCTNCSTDKGIYEIVNEDFEVNINMVDKIYDYIVIDEAQDLKLIYFQIILKIAKFFYEKNENLKLIISGDERQTIYKYNGASEFAVTKAEEILKKFNWKRLGLTKSFRCPKVICEFVNDHIFKKDYIFDNGTEGIFDFKIANIFENKVIEKIADYIERDIEEFGLENVVILTTFFSKRDIVQKVNNKLSNRGIHIFVSEKNKDICIDKNLHKNKSISTTIHQTKGLEKAVVYLFNFDNFYKKISFTKNDLIEEWKQKVENLLYVACTRAKKKLVIFNHCTTKPIEILLTSPYPLTVDEVDISLANITKERIKKIWEKSEKYDNHITMLSPITEEIEKWEDYLISEFIEKNFEIVEETIVNKKISIKSKVYIDNEEKDLAIFEEVSTINGNFAGLLGFFQKESWIKEIKEIIDNKISLYIASIDNESQEWKESKEASDYLDFFKKIKEINEELYKDKEFSDLQKKIRYAIIINCLSSFLIFKLNQIPIKNCNWINDDEYKKMVENYNVLFDPKKNLKLEFEKLVYRRFKEKNLLGSIDLLDNTNKGLWEFKFVDDVKAHHLIQPILYYWTLMSNDKDKIEFKEYSLNLYNIKKGKNYKIKFKGQNFEKTVEEFLIQINKEAEAPKLDSYIRIYKKYFEN